MPQTSLPTSGKHLILVVDDEPDVHAVTKLSLKSLRHTCGPVESLFASSGVEALTMMREHPDIGVVLLDVVMETDTAGLDTCRAIRGELNNQLVRILLRTGQPDLAPEQLTIETYDIDGYLAKTETSSSRLVSAVRCALKSYRELVLLDRHRKYLALVHDCALSLSATQSVDQMLRPILETALAICPAPLVALRLESFEQVWGPRHLCLHLFADPHFADHEQARVEALRVRVETAGVSAWLGPRTIESGFLIPLRLHRELGRGWLFVEGVAPDDLTQKVLTLLAGHAQNAFYASIALAALGARRNTVFEDVAI